MLRQRAALLQQLRQFFLQRGYLEVETPLLSADTVVDRHIDPLSVTLYADASRPQQGRRLWLQTSPEFAMKRLLAAGGTSLFQITKAFRAGEQGRWHNPEFTIAEWYQVGQSMPQAIQLLSELCQVLLGSAPAEPICYRDAFRRFAQLDPLTASNDELRQACRRHQIVVPQGLSPDDRDGWLDLLLVECVELQLGRSCPAILYDYPASQAALAQVRREEPPVAERFELYVNGIELANGYHELLDADVLRQRNARINQQRQADGKFALPEESFLLAAMQHGLPDCCGVALGFDRLVMLATGAQHIAEVIPFPIERA